MLAFICHENTWQLRKWFVQVVIQMQMFRFKALISELPRLKCDSSDENLCEPSAEDAESKSSSFLGSMLVCFLVES